MSALGAHIQTEMNKRGWNQSTLAEKSGVPDASLSRILKTERRPSPVNVIKLAVALGEKPEELMVLAGYPVGNPATPDANEQELLAQLRALPWLGDLTRDIATLPPRYQKIVADVVRSMLDSGEGFDQE